MSLIRLVVLGAKNFFVKPLMVPVTAFVKPVMAPVRSDSCLTNISKTPPTTKVAILRKSRFLMTSPKFWNPSTALPPINSTTSFKTLRIVGQIPTADSSKTPSKIPETVLTALVNLPESQLTAILIPSMMPENARLPAFLRYSRGFSAFNKPVTNSEIPVIRFEIPTLRRSTPILTASKAY